MYNTHILNFYNTSTVPKTSIKISTLHCFKTVRAIKSVICKDAYLFQFLVMSFHCPADSSFNLPIIAGYSTHLASFLTQWVWLCLLLFCVYSCFSACQALKTIYYFLTQNQILLPPKTVCAQCTSNEFRCGKTVGFPQHSYLNSNSITPLVVLI